MTMHRTFRSAALVAAALALGTGAAVAQPAGGPYGPGFGGHHAMMMGGPHGAGPDGAMIGGLIAKAKTQLNLDTSQQLAFDNAVAAGKAAREAARARHLAARDAIKAELAAAEPNLEAVAKLADDLQQQDHAARVAVRTQWLNLYKMFNAEQKAVVRDLIQKRIARVEQFRQKMRERMQERLGSG